MKLFHSLPTHAIGAMIYEARKRVVYAAPSMSDAVASSLVMKHRNAGVSVTVILDYNENLFRLGYGEYEAVNMLLEAGIYVRKEPNLRIGCLIIDNQGWAFYLPPMAVESQSSFVHLNAFELTSDQVDRFAVALGIPENGKAGKPPGYEPEIGREPISEEEVTATNDAMKNNPPQAFDLQRQVRVYQARLKFVELELEGGNIQQRTIRLPSELKKSLFANDKEIEERLNASYKLIDAEAYEKLASLRKEVEALRNNYAPSLGKRLGRVILNSKRVEFEEKVKEIRERLEQYCQEARDDLQASIENSLENLANNLAPILYQRPPEELSSRCEKITLNICRDYLLDILRKVAPSAPEVLENTRLHMTFKDVTIEMLRDREFQQKVKQEFRYEDWIKPFSEFTAAQSKDHSLYGIHNPR